MNKKWDASDFRGPSELNEAHRAQNFFQYDCNGQT